MTQQQAVAKHYETMYKLWDMCEMNLFDIRMILFDLWTEVLVFQIYAGWAVRAFFMLLVALSVWRDNERRRRRARWLALHWKEVQNAGVLRGIRGHDDS